MAFNSALWSKRRGQRARSLNHFRFVIIDNSDRFQKQFASLNFKKDKVSLLVHGVHQFPAIHLCAPFEWLISSEKQSPFSAPFALGILASCHWPHQLKGAHFEHSLKECLFTASRCLINYFLSLHPPNGRPIKLTHSKLTGKLA